MLRISNQLQISLILNFVLSKSAPRDLSLTSAITHTWGTIRGIQYERSPEFTVSVCTTRPMFTRQALNALSLCPGADDKDDRPYRMPPPNALAIGSLHLMQFAAYNTNGIGRIRIFHPVIMVLIQSAMDIASAVAKHVPGISTFRPCLPDYI